MATDSLLVGQVYHRYHDTVAFGNWPYDYIVRKVNRVTVWLENERGQRLKVTKQFALANLTAGSCKAS